MAKKLVMAIAVGGLFAAALPALLAKPPAAVGALPPSDPAMAAASAPALEVWQNPARFDPEATVEIGKTLTLKRGDNLFDLLSRAGASRDDANAAIAALSTAQSPKKLNAGQEVRMTLTKAVASKDAGTLTRLSLPIGFGRELVVAKEGGAFKASTVEAAAMDVRSYAEGVIEDSLYLAALREGVPLPVVAEMIRLFSFDVDFQRDIWPGDSFRLYYERALARDGEAEPGGRILSATLMLRGKEFTYYRFIDAGGDAEYYTADGQSARKMLMKTPIDGARLSSRFGMRKHPILGYSRMHKGTDFAAPTGTPIYAAGNGTVERASPYGSYGNYIRIRHNSTYSTAYGHLSRYAKGIKAGAHVHQGQIIGYVGATGGATGPHLHYEILVNGSQVNPASLRFPKEKSLNGRELASFRVAVGAAHLQQNAIQGLRRIASAVTAAPTAGAPTP
jgi:murein DD-endopeptidase MepM/ murein hydrolase activator NlpD